MSGKSTCSSPQDKQGAEPRHNTSLGRKAQVTNRRILPGLEARLILTSFFHARARDTCTVFSNPSLYGKSYTPPNRISSATRLRV